MKMELVDLTAQNIDKIGTLFPDCNIEIVDENGKPKAGERTGHLLSFK